MSNMKRCSLCGKELLLSEFSKHNQTKDKLSLWCKKCSNAKARVFRSTPSGVYTQIKGRNKFYQGKPFEITRDEFINWYENTPKKCVYCGLSEEDLPNIDDSYNNKSLRMSIDAIDNDTGYVLGNIVLCCNRCNSIKSDLLSFDEMLEFGKKYIKHHWEQQLGHKI